jgi:SAM-dependent methyltransferase
MTANRHNVALGFPGPSLSFGAAKGLWTATMGLHDVTVVQSPLGAWDAFNRVWCDALNMARRGEASHFAMLHADIEPQEGWMDVLLDECDRLDAECVSAVVPLKEATGLTSTAIGDPADPWHPWRRFTLREIAGFPDTFDAAAAGYPDRPLLVNTGCLVCDLRKPAFWQRRPDGQMPVCFNFPTLCAWGPDGKAVVLRESEDWYFSRQLAAAGGKAYATRKVHLHHLGTWPFPNYGEPWGQYLHGDEESAQKWDAENSRIDLHGSWLGDGKHYHKEDIPLGRALCGFLAGLRHKTDNAVVDFGCGLGYIVRMLRIAGIAADGFDGNPATPELTDGLCGVLDLAVEQLAVVGDENLTTDNCQLTTSPWDWVLCLEVLEHIPAEFESVALDNLARHARKGIIASWAPEGQPGHGHFNCRSLDYAIARFAERGFHVADAATAALRAASSLPWFKKNLLVLEKAESGKLTTGN